MSIGFILDKFANSTAVALFLNIGNVERNNGTIVQGSGGLIHSLINAQPILKTKGGIGLMPRARWSNVSSIWARKPVSYHSIRDEAYVITLRFFML